MSTRSPEARDRMTPNDALAVLKAGNERFRENLAINRDLLTEVEETCAGQWPYAAILGCIDSRASAELIFDQGIGDVFSTRIAGNFVNDDILGSLEFACRVAGAKLVAVIGHSECGAIKGACDGVELGHLTGMLGKIQPAVDAVASPADPEERGSSNREFVAAVARENVLRTVREVTERSGVLREMCDAGEIDVVGGMYDIASGEVDFL